jgi:hypothetical protein
MSAPRLATTQPMTHRHCACYYKIRTIVRTLFFIGFLLGALWVGGWVDSIDLPAAPHNNNQPTQGKVIQQ